MTDKKPTWATLNNKLTEIKDKIYHNYYKVDGNRILTNYGSITLDLTRQANGEIHIEMDAWGKNSDTLKFKSAERFLTCANAHDLIASLIRGYIELWKAELPRYSDPKPPHKFEFWCGEINKEGYVE